MLGWFAHWMCSADGVDVEYEFIVLGLVLLGLIRVGLCSAQLVYAGIYWLRLGLHLINDGFGVCLCDIKCVFMHSINSYKWPNKIVMLQISMQMHET